MSNKKFISRTSFILSIIALVATSYNLYVGAVNHYRLVALETRLEHAEGIMDTFIRSKAEAARAEIKRHPEVRMEGEPEMNGPRKGK